MRVILYMATTPNGLVAGKNDDTGWVTKKEWKGFSAMIRKAGNMVIGRRTYEVMLQSNEFEKSKLAKVKTVVLTHKNGMKAHDPKFVAVARTPKEALKILREQGFGTAMLCGGGKANAGFMKEKLVDEVYLDVEPTLIGRGTALFEGADFEAKLRLIGTKKISRDEVQLHYKAVK